MRAKKFVTLLASAATLASVAPLVAAQSASAVAPSCSSVNIGLTSLAGPNFYIDNGQTPSFNNSYTGYKVTNSTGSAMSDTWVQISNLSGNITLASGQAAAEQIPSLGVGVSSSVFFYLSTAAKTTTAQNFTVNVYRHDPALAGATALCTMTDGFSTVAGSTSANPNKVTGITVSGGAPVLGSTFIVTVTGNTGQIGSGTTGDPQMIWMSPSVAANWPADSFRLLSTNLNIPDVSNGTATDHPNILRLTNLGATKRDYTATYTFRAINFTSSPTQVKPVQEISNGSGVAYTGRYSATLPTIAQPTNTLHVGLVASPQQVNLGGGSVDYTGTLYGTAGSNIDTFTVTPPSSATFGAGSAKYDGASIADPLSGSGQLVFPGPFPLTSSSAPLTFKLQLPATPGDRVTTLTGQLGSAVIGTDTGDVSGASPATASVNVDAAPAAGDFAITAAKGRTTPAIDLLAHVTDPNSSDTLTITAASSGTHGAVSLSGRFATYTSTSNYTGPDSFTYTASEGRGATATGTVNVRVTGVTPQTITFPSLDDMTLGGTQSVGASSSSGLPVAYSSLTPTTCTVDATTGVVTALAVGTCTIAVDQDGDSTYLPAEEVTQDVTVSKRSQSITFDTLDPLYVGDTETASATSDSPAPWSTPR